MGKGRDYQMMTIVPGTLDLSRITRLRCTNNNEWIFWRLSQMTLMYSSVLSPSLYLTLSLPLSIYLYLSFSLYLSLSFSLLISLFHGACVHASVCVYVSICVVTLRVGRCASEYVCRCKSMPEKFLTKIWQTAKMTQCMMKRCLASRGMVCGGNRRVME